MSASEKTLQAPASQGVMSSKNDLILVAVVSVSAMLPFVLAPFRAQILGPSGRGEFAFFQSSVTTAGIFAALGLRFACYEFDLLDSNRFRFRLHRLSVFSTIGALFVLIPTVWVGFVQISPIVGWAVAATVIFAPGSALVQIETANANHIQNRGRIALISSTSSMLEFFSTLLLVILQRFSLIAALVTTFVAETLRSGIAVFWHVRDRQRIPLAERRNNAELERKIVSASIRNAPAVVIPLLSGNIDVLVFALSTETTALGHYAVAKLGFSAMLISSAVLEGRFMSAFRISRGRGLLNVVTCAIVLATAGGLAGWILTPLVFGSEFRPSATAFPLLAAAGAFAFVFSSLSAVAAQDRHNSIYPGLSVLAVLVASCSLIPTVIGSDVVSLSWALVSAQLVGVVIVLIQFLHRGWKK